MRRTPECLLIRKDYPTTGVLKLLAGKLLLTEVTADQEGLPDYWGIETCHADVSRAYGYLVSGRITRLLGY